ncbi:hypothetical protein [Belliella pelovolcani]|uniref:hypothetical protein n=1 Tax=Belliella pelovolcani TaxID=529505 RepID=UPI0039190107
MEQLIQILDPVFVAAIIALAELLRKFAPKGISPRIITIVAAIAVGVAFYFGKELTFVESLINTIASLLTSAGVYSLFVKPVKDEVSGPESPYKE